MNTLMTQQMIFQQFFQFFGQTAGVVWDDKSVSKM